MARTGCGKDIKEIKYAERKLKEAKEELDELKGKKTELQKAREKLERDKEELRRLDYRQNWDRQFLKLIKNFEKKKPVIVCGDLNCAHKEIDLARPKQNVGKKGFTDEEREGFQSFIDAGFVDTLRQKYPETPDLYTWWSHWGKARERNVGWRIDYFFVSPSLIKKLKRSIIRNEVYGSDHCPVEIELDI